MKYVEGDISLELSNILDKKLAKMLILIFEFNSEIIGEINYNFPSVISTSKELRESLVEKISLYSEMYNKIKITEEFEGEMDNKLIKEFNEELDALITVSTNLIEGIEEKETDILKKNIVEFERLCKGYDEKVIEAKE